MKTICVKRNKKNLSEGKLIYMDIDEPKMPECGNFVILKNLFAGVHHDDINFLNGTYSLFDKETHPSDFISIGLEGVGKVVEVGKNVKNISLGGVYGYMISIIGAYSEYVCIHKELLIKIPDTVNPAHACGAMRRGFLVYSMFKRGVRIFKDDYIVVNSVTSGVGHILAQFASSFNIKVIGIYGSELKANYAESLGCSATINRLTDVDYSKKILEITKGEGVRAVFDGIGLDAYENSIKSLKTFGTYIKYGNVSGDIDSKFKSIHFKEKALFFHNQNLDLYQRIKSERVFSAMSIFKAMESFKLRIRTSEYSYQNIETAFDDIKNGKTIGSAIIKF